MIPDAWTKEPGPTEAEVLMLRQVHRGSFLIEEPRRPRRRDCSPAQRRSLGDLPGS